MRFTEQLLNAQSRPPAEAERITHAMADSADNDASAAEQVAAAEAAADAASYAIADEKRAPRGPVPAGHTAEFVDDALNIPVFDDAPESGGGHRSNPRYLLDAEPDPTPEPEPAPVPLTPWERDAAAAAAAVPEAEPAPVPQPEPEPEPEPAPEPRPRFTVHPLKAVGIAAVGILLAMTIGYSMTHGGRGEPPPSAEPAGQVAAPPTAVDNTPTPQTDAPLVPATVSASCGNDSDAVAPFSGDRTRAWVCQRLNGLDLNVLNIQFSGPVVIKSVCVVPGFNYVAPDGRDEWARHRLVTAVAWRMGGKVYEQLLTPTRTGVCQEFPSVITQEMSMTITGSMRPTAEADPTAGPTAEADDAEIDTAVIDEATAISEIVITGHPVDPGAATGGTP